MIKRSTDEVIHYLKNYRSEYNCDHYEIDNETNNSNILRNIEKKGEIITIVVRPTDYGWIEIHNSDEAKELENENCELWGHNGKGNPKILTLGTLVICNSLIGKRLNVPG